MNDFLEEIDKYLNQEMSVEEVQNFEQRLKTDAQLAEELKLQKDMRVLYHEKDWAKGDIAILKRERAKQLTSFFNSDEAESIKSVITTVVEENRFKKSKRNQYLSIAAAIAVLLSVSTFLFKGAASSDSLYAAYINIESIPSLVTRGETNNELLENAQLLFEDKLYALAIETIISYQASNEDVNPLSYIYLGVSYIETQVYDSAIDQFDRLANSNTLQSKKADWYKALVYLKKDDKKMVKQLLQKIVTNTTNFKYKEAKELLSEL